MRAAKLLLLITLVALMGPSNLWADSVTWSSNGYQFEAWANSGGSFGFYEVTLKVTNGNASTGYLQGFSLKDMFSGALTNALLTSPAGGGTASAHIGFNNGSGNCSGNDPYAFCVDTGLGYGIGATPVEFVVSVDGSGNLSSLSGWHLQTLVTDRMCKGTGCTGRDDKDTKTLVAISSSGTVHTPEPATLSLLGTGLLGLGAVRRRKR